MTTYRAVTEQECDRLLALCEQKDLQIARLRRAVEWQPIETAPKTGQRILVSIHGVDRAVLCSWSGAEWNTFDGHNWHGKRMTHWMPLPAPPGADLIKLRDAGNAHTGEKP